MQHITVALETKNTFKNKKQSFGLSRHFRWNLCNLQIYLRPLPTTSIPPLPLSTDSVEHGFRWYKNVPNDSKKNNCTVMKYMYGRHFAASIGHLILKLPTTTVVVCFVILTISNVIKSFNQFYSADFISRNPFSKNKRIVYIQSGRARLNIY